MRPLDEAADGVRARIERRLLEDACVILRKDDRLLCGDVWQDPVDASAVDQDPAVLRLRAALAATGARPEDPDAASTWASSRAEILAALSLAENEAYLRLSDERAAEEERAGTVLTPDARRWLSHLVELNGSAAVCAKFDVDAGVLQRLLEGVPTPPSWRTVPPAP